MSKTLIRIVNLTLIGTTVSALALLAIPDSIKSSGRSGLPPQCPNPPEVNISSQIPGDVCIPDDFGGNPIAFFDDYSWKTFIAMVWPAQTGNRGVADASKGLGDTGPRVFETFKSDWEVFQPLGAEPSEWQSFQGTNPCSIASVGFGDLILASFSKFGNVGQAGFGELVGPLVAQNNTYVRYLTGFNQSEFDQIRAGKLYVRPQNGFQGVVFQNGAVDVKSAWIDMKNISHPERYYVHHNAWVFDPETNNCSQKDIGLVGLHIVQKTPSRPQWIWSSFEQVDNIPQASASPSFAFNDGTAAPMPTQNPIAFPPPDVPPTKFNVTRLKPIHNDTTVPISTTVQTNTKYRQALASAGAGPWQFYQLVMTQWPLQLNPPQPIPPDQSGKPANTFPRTGATTAFSNVTMETFDQRSITTGCMNCHDQTRTATDFLWVLNLHAFDSTNPLSPPSLPPLHGTPGVTVMSSMKKNQKLSPALRALKQLLQSATPKPKSKPRPKPRSKNTKPK